VIETPDVPSSTGPPRPGGRQGGFRWRRAPGQPGLPRGNPLLLEVQRQMESGQLNLGRF